MLNLITPVILTYNEAPNIERTLAKLTWANRIVIIDSYSTDDTLALAKAHPQVDILQRKFDTHAAQWNYGLAQVTSDWVLSLDADYVLSDRLIEEIAHLAESTKREEEEIAHLAESAKGKEKDAIAVPEKTAAYAASFRYCILGKPLKGTILPPREILFKRDCSTYIDDGHTQRLTVQGESSQLVEPVFHDDRKPLSRWLWAQDRYMVIEAHKLLETADNDLSFSDKLRKRKVIAPFVILIYCLVVKGGLLDGWRGWYYAFQRMFAETLLSLRLIETSKQQTSLRHN